jgi:hypothetical protein
LKKNPEQFVVASHSRTDAFNFIKMHEINRIVLFVNIYSIPFRALFNVFKDDQFNYHGNMLPGSTDLDSGWTLQASSLRLVFRQFIPY